VRSLEDGFYTRRYIPAKIRVRRGVYRYLCWRDGLKKLEFYLGKIKICAPRDVGRSSTAPAGAGIRRQDPAGVQK